jgi:cell division protein FtsI/penicillin-binding protein 2
VLGGIILLRLFSLQVIQHQHYLAVATKEHQRKYEVAAKRGEIFVRDGDIKVPLALNQTLKLLYADPSIIPEGDKAKTAQALAGVTGDPVSFYLTALQQSKEYVVLKTKVPGDMASKIKNQNLYGIGLIDQDYRVYPEGQLASQLLGFVNGDGDGQYGVEGYMDDKLKGDPGQLNAKTDTNGVPIATADNIIKQPVDGSSVVLTIDRNIQAQAEQFLKKGVENAKAKSGSVVVIDPKTGAVKAMANYPTYDPNDFGNVTDYSLFTNSIVSDQFEPGSGFKVITMSAGLDTGKVHPDTTYDDTGSVQIDGYTVSNAAGHKDGPGTNMMKVIRDSLNTGVVFVLRQLGTDPNKITPQSKKVLYDYVVKHFGFGVRTGIEQADEAQGYVHAPDHASDVNYANMTFGQGISVTMMQMVTAVSAIANGGKMYQPYLVDQTISPDGTESSRTLPRVVNDHVISAQAAHDITAMMQVVVEHGSGYLAHLPGYNIAGKTGTAQIPRADGKGYEDNKNIGSFVGFGPVEDPRFVLMVRINEPQINGFAETTTVPVFANISKWLLQYYAIPPSS